MINFSHFIIIIISIVSLKFAHSDTHEDREFINIQEVASAIETTQSLLADYFDSNSPEGETVTYATLRKTLHRRSDFLDSNSIAARATLIESSPKVVVELRTLLYKSDLFPVVAHRLAAPTFVKGLIFAKDLRAHLIKPVFNRFFTDQRIRIRAMETISKHIHGATFSERWYGKRFASREQTELFSEAFKMFFPDDVEPNWLFSSVFEGRGADVNAAVELFSLLARASNENLKNQTQTDLAGNSSCHNPFLN